MNITLEIATGIGGEVEKIINSHKEIQIYSDPDMFRYLWRDNRFENTCDIWRDENNKLKTRGELKETIINHLKSVGDLQ